MDRDALCHRCRNARVRVYGLQCAECQKITDAEYWAERERRGGKLLYLEGVDLERVTRGMREDDDMWDDPEASGDEDESAAASPLSEHAQRKALRGERDNHSQRDAAILAAASEGEESYTQIGIRYGITSERVRQIVRSGPANGNGPRCVKCKEPFEPSTHGWAKTTCKKCRSGVVRSSNWATPRTAPPATRVTAVAHVAVPSPQELADRLTDKVLGVVDEFDLSFNLGSCLRLLLERDLRRPENELADLLWARKYLDRAIALLQSRIQEPP